MADAPERRPARLPMRQASLSPPREKLAGRNGCDPDTERGQGLNKRTCLDPIARFTEQAFNSAEAARADHKHVRRLRDNEVDQIGAGG
jgi:hypothetical protein